MRVPEFPRQLFRRFVLQQLAMVIPSILLFVIAARIYLGRASSFATAEEAVDAYDRALIFIVAGVALSVAVICLVTAYRLILPLSRVLIKARSLVKRDPNRQDARSGHEIDEWGDLESALHRIGREIRNQEKLLLREREEIEAIMSAIAEAVVAVDAEGNVLFYNSQFSLQFGDLGRKGRRLSDFLRNPDILDAFRRALAQTENATLDCELRVRGDDRPRSFSLSLAPLKLSEGGIYGAVGVFHDVTELKRMERIRIDFVANVSHELQTPLTSIKGYAETLVADLAAQPQSRPMAETILRNSDRLIALVKDLLSLSMLESHGELEHAPIDLGELTRQVQQQLAQAAAAKNHTVETQVSAPVLHADPKRVEQVLFNLMENAIKYVPMGGRIDVRWNREGNEVVLRVRDNGPGIAPEHRSRIFERFYRVDSGRGRDQGGTGLGLSIVKHIVQRYGGRVSVEPVRPQGSEFVCTFREPGAR